VFCVTLCVVLMVKCKAICVLCDIVSSAYDKVEQFVFCVTCVVLIEM
jgi:hypothetical protein